MSVNPIKGKFIKISNDEAFKAAKLDGSDKEILKVNSADQVILLDLPIVDDGVAPASNVATEAYVDGEISTLADAIDGRIDDHVGGFAELHSADHIVFAPIGATTSIEVQAAIEEVQLDASQGIADAATAQSAIDAHLLDTADAHDASAISFDPGVSGLVADNVQAALSEIQGSLSGLSFEASAISSIPAGNLASSNVQDALNELDTEKVAKAGDTMTGDLIMDHAEISQDFSDVGAGVTEGHSFAQGNISSTYADTTDSWSSEIFAGGESISRTNTLSSTSDVSIVMTSTDAASPLTVNINNYASNFVSVTEIGMNGFVNVNLQDAVTGDDLSSEYGAGQFSLTMNHSDGTAESILAQSDGITVTHFDGVAFVPVLPSTNMHLTPKKYVDDADTAIAGSISSHLSDTVDAHDASAISVAAGITNLAATEVQGALAELQADVDGRAVIALSNLAATTALNSDLNFAKGAGVNANIRGKSYVPGEASGVFQVFSGSVSGGVNSGALALFSGNIVTGTTGNTGAADVRSGHVIDGTSGLANLHSGDASGAGSSGAAQVYTGVALGVGNSGVIYVESGSANSGNSGAVNIGSGSSTSGATGSLALYTSAVVGASNSGIVNMTSGTSVNGTSGQLRTASGAVSGSGASGAIIFESGNTTSGTSGIAVLNSGDAAAGSSGALYVQSGTAGAGNSGNVIIESGTATGTRGAVQISSRVVEINSEIDMQAHKIIDMADGVNPADAVNMSQLDAGLDLKLDLAGGDMTGDINMQNHKILHLTMNTDADCAATKQYVDNVAEGLHVHAPVRAVRATQIVGTYDNGVDGVGATITPTAAISNVDGIGSFATTQRIMVSGQSNTWENGIYTVTAVDGSNHITELTRASDFDTTTEVAGGDFIFVQAGNTYANTGWVETETTTALGFGVSDPILFLQFSGAGSYSAGDGLNLDGTVFSVDVTDLVGFGVGHDSSNNFRIHSEAAGDGIAGGDGVALSVDHDGLGLTFNAAQLSLAVDGMSIDKTTGSVLQVKDLGISSAKIINMAVTADKIHSDVAGFGLSKSGFTGALDVNVDGSTLEINMSDALQVKTSGITEMQLDTLSVSTGKLQNDSVTAAKINSDVAGFGLSKSGFAGALDVNVDMSTIEINMSDALQVRDSGITEMKLANLSVSTGKLQDDSVTAFKINSDVAGDGLTKGILGALKVNVDGSTLEINMSDALQVKDAGITEFKLATDSVSTIKIINTAVTAVKINSDVAGLGLSKSGFTDALDVNVGDGLEINMSDAVQIKLDGTSLSVSGSGIKSNIIWHKESYAVPSALSLGAFFDLAHVAEVDSISAFVDRLAIHEGASEDYSVDYTGGAGGNTRIYFLNTLVGSGSQRLTSGDTVFFKYQRKAA
jgi:hypothetical protein